MGSLQAAMLNEIEAEFSGPSNNNIDADSFLDEKEPPGDLEELTPRRNSIYLGKNPTADKRSSLRNSPLTRHKGGAQRILKNINSANNTPSKPMRSSTTTPSRFNFTPSSRSSSFTTPSRMTRIKAFNQMQLEQQQQQQQQQQQHQLTTTPIISKNRIVSIHKRLISTWFVRLRY